jgi:hypothetical protein
MQQEAWALQRDGYATDPNYANNLLAVFDGKTMRNAIAIAQARDQMNVSNAFADNLKAEYYLEEGADTLLGQDGNDYLDGIDTSCRLLAA